MKNKMKTFYVYRDDRLVAVVRAFTERGACRDASSNFDVSESDLVAQTTVRDQRTQQRAASV